LLVGWFSLAPQWPAPEVLTADWFIFALPLIFDHHTQGVFRFASVRLEGFDRVLITVRLWSFRSALVHQSRLCSVGSRVKPWALVSSARFAATGFWVWPHIFDLISIFPVLWGFMQVIVGIVFEPPEKRLEFF
jgi:hypothetical protein